VLHVVPPLVSLLAQYPALKVESLSQTHTITCGAAPLSVKTSVTLLERLNNPNLSLQEGITFICVKEESSFMLLLTVYNYY
jgi:hypothetical protein